MLHSYDTWFMAISELVLCHSPSGAEAEIDRLLLGKLASLGVEHYSDPAGNIVARLPGQTDERCVAITAHKDEIAAIVKRVEPDGTLQVRKLGGAFPWVYGEGVVDVLGDYATLSGILSFGSRHVSHESPQRVFQDERPLRWEDAWVETKQTPLVLDGAGVRPGSRVVIGKHRKEPFRLGDYIASYTLDNKASVAILLELAKRLPHPRCDTYLVFSAAEEVGAIGAMYFTQNTEVDALVALEIVPKSREYPRSDDRRPVLLSQDGYGIYHEALNRELRDAAAAGGVELVYAVLAGFGSDGSIAMKNGHVAQAACLGFPTDNTHGYEIAHLGAIEGCLEVLMEWLAG